MLRVGFGLVQAVILGITFLIQAKINQQKDDEAHQKEIEGEQTINVPISH